MQVIGQLVKVGERHSSADSSVSCLTEVQARALLEVQHDADGHHEASMLVAVEQALKLEDKRGCPSCLLWVGKPRSQKSSTL